MNEIHIPVLLNDVVRSLAPKPGERYLDLTAGYGGHADKILEVTQNYNAAVLNDRDQNAIDYLKAKYQKVKPIFTHDDFYSTALRLVENGEKFGMILADFGVSSPQLDNLERGFSFAKDARLDMRMDQTGGKSAWEVVNNYEKSKLSYIFSVYGEEKFAENIAKNICEERKIKPIDTTGELVRIIDKSIPYKFKQNGHPAKKVFQAIRIEVNEELDGLSECLKTIVKRLKKGGRLAVITFHSLEDRIVKQTFKDLETDCICDKRLPICVCGKKREIKLVNKKPIEASVTELNENSRSRSAKLRIIEKI